MGRMVMSRSLIGDGLLVVLSERCLPVQDAYWLVYPPRSRERRELLVFRAWLLAEAAAYCRQMPSRSRRRKPERTRGYDVRSHYRIEEDLP